MARLNIEISANGANKTDKSIKSVSDRVERLDTEINNLTKTQKNLLNVSHSLQGQMRNLNNAFNQGTISQDQYEAETRQLGNQLSSVGGKIQQVNSRLSSLKATQNQLSNSTRTLGTAQGQLQAYSNDFTSGIRSSNAVAVEFSRVVQDMPYGIQGVSNNLQQLTQNWSYYARAAREAAAAQGQTVSTMGLLRGTLRSLANPLNLLTIGISLITAGWVAYDRYQQRANKAMREGANAAKDYAASLNNLSRALYNASRSYGNDIARMNTLMGVLRTATATQEQRNEALDELQKMYPAVFKNYNTETILTEEATAAYNALTKSIIAKTNALAAESLLVERKQEQFGLIEENKERQRQVKITEDQIAADKRRADQLLKSITPGTSKEEADILVRQAESLTKAVGLNGKINKLKEEQSEIATEISKKQESINDLTDLALSEQLKVNDALLETSKGTEKAAKNARDFVDAISRVFDFDTSGASLINMTYTNAEIQKVRNEYEKLINNVDRLEKEGLNRNKDNEAERTRILREAELERAEIRKAQNIAVADAIYKQETAALEKSIQDQRDLYEDYEKWRQELGEKSANERYAAELSAIRSFASNLEAEVTALAAKGLSMDGLTDSEKERYDALSKILQDFYKSREAEENKHLTALLKSYATFEEKRTRLAEQYYKDVEVLSGEQRRNRSRQYVDDLAREIQNEINESDAFRNLDLSLDFDGIKRSKAAVKLARDFMSDFFRDLKPKPGDEEAAARQLEKSMQKTLDKIDLSLDEKAFDVTVDLVSSFGNLVELADDFDGSLGAGLKTISKMVSEVGNVASGLGKALGAAGGGLSQIGGFAGIAGAVIGVVGGIFDAINARQKREQEELMERYRYMEEYRIKQMERQTKLLQGQYAIINDIYGIEKLDAYAKILSDINREQERLLKIQNRDTARPRPDQFINDGRFKFLLNTGIKEVDEWIERYNRALSSTDPNVRQNAGQWIDQINREAKAAGVSLQELEFNLKDLSATDIVELRSLIDTGGLDEATASFLNTIIDLTETQLEAIRSLREELTGTTFEEVADGFVDIFTRGEDAIEDFEKSFDDLIRKSLVQSLRRSIMTEALKGWYERFADFAQSGGGLTEMEIDQLRREYQAIGEQIKTNAENLEKATGVSLSDPGDAAAARGLTGSIERLSEQTGSELAGLYRATFELNKQELGYVQRMAVSSEGILVSVQQSADLLADIAATNAEIADNTAHLEAIALAAEQIAKNTDQKSLRDIGL